MAEQDGAEIATLIREINAGLNQRIRETFKDKPITPPQMMIIFMLAEEKRLKVSEISKKMSLANSTVSGILDRLEKQDYIKRVRSESDKRVVYVEATDQMKVIFDQHHQAMTEFLAYLVRDVTAKEFKTILDGLDILRNLVQTNGAKEKG
ncbi:MarR family transcriptional regulator [Paraliobacillus quinghaiensis]|uniref:MarR family transcriptional regulator n=1 Tax=Paraliobacillus quinghaiensis TaxID=470815 RepID=A0A917TXS3_9BACI|nr:MarR family transcriptional regulator [Paraliobacillus quinghaiensis]GGM41798.1 MarR family transcriptional regulator [Paraliobacillus quinghaiensis]